MSLGYLTLAWDDLVVPATLVNPPGLPSAPTYNINTVTLDFENSKNAVQQLIFQMPHGYACGTDARFHIHWQPSNTNTDDARFQIDWQWRNNGDVNQAIGSWNSVITDITPSGVVGKLQIDELAIFTKADSEISSIIQVQVARLGVTDAYTGDVQVVSQDSHIRKNSSGSKLEYTK